MAEQVINELLLEDKLVELWSCYPCLFDVSSPEFKNRDKREQANEDLAEKVGQSAEWVKNKLRLLRNSYTKAKKPASSGSARKNPSKRTVWLLEKLQFMAPYCLARPTTSNLEFESSPSTKDFEENEDEVELDVVVEEPCTFKSTKLPNTCKPKSAKRKREEEELQLMKDLSASIRQTPAADNYDELDYFGKYIAQSLRKMDQRARLLVQQGINNCLLQAQFGSLSQQLPSTQCQQYQGAEWNGNVPVQYNQGAEWNGNVPAGLQYNQSRTCHSDLTNADHPVESSTYFNL